MSALSDASPAAARPSRARWPAAVLLCMYGFAKLTGSQFTVLDSELTRPLGEVSGFWLTWHYFGYSPFYKTAIALVEIGGGVLLAWPRTALLGAVLLLPVMANIVLIDVFYGVNADATLAACFILACLLAVVMPHVARLKAAVLLDAPPRGAALRACALALILVGSYALTWWAANVNNIRPTPVDGIWTAVPEAETAPWAMVFFEKNRAYWATFRRPDGAEERRHFEVDAAGTVRVWERWRSKGALLMEGRIQGDGRLELVTVGAEPRARVVLTRRAPAGS